jgi:hypothetical protein
MHALRVAFLNVNIPMTFFTVIRAELPNGTVDDMKLRVPGVSLGTIVTEALRTVLPELEQRPAPRLARGSEAGVGVDANQPTDLDSLRRGAMHTPPPQRFAATYRIPIPSEVWREVEKQRLRLGMSVDAVVAFAIRRTYAT